MVHLLLGNIEPDTMDEEIREFLMKYGFPPYDESVHVPGDGSRPAVALTFHELDPETLGKLQPRVRDLFWKNRRVSAVVLRDRFT